MAGARLFQKREKKKKRKEKAKLVCVIFIMWIEYIYSTSESKIMRNETTLMLRIHPVNNLWSFCFFVHYMVSLQTCSFYTLKCTLELQLLRGSCQGLLLLLKKSVIKALFICKYVSIAYRIIFKSSHSWVTPFWSWITICSWILFYCLKPSFSHL